MITIIHGDNIPESRKFYTSIKDKTASHHLLEGENVTKQALVQIIEGGELFSEEKNIFIENFLSKKKSPTLIKDIAEYLSSHSSEVQVVMWEGKEITAANTKLFKGASVQDFKLPKLLFSFLDQFLLLAPQERVSAFHSVIETLEPDLVFFMMVRHIRLLLAVQSPTQRVIDEVKVMRDWQRSKLLSLSHRFTQEYLKNLYNKLYAIDLRTKTGATPLSLTQSIDFLLLEM